MRAGPGDGVDIGGGARLRLLEPADSMAELTELLHRAYAPLLAMGLRFVATHQDADTTRARAAEGECWVAEAPGHGPLIAARPLIATITLRPPGSSRGTPCYERPDVAVFGQFAVAPEHQGKGLGSAILDAIEARALALGAGAIACDTSEQAARLIRYYERRGYRFVENVRWSEVNYRSVVLSKPLGGLGPRVDAALRLRSIP